MLNQSEDMGADEFRKVRSAERALDLLELLATSVEGLSFSQIGSALGLPKSSLSGLIRTLDARGYVTRTGDGRRFRLGPRIAELSAGLRQDEDIIGAARRAARRLAQQLGEGAHVAILDGDSVIYIAVEDSTHSMHMASAVGQRLPTHATAVGKSLLAVLSDSAIDLLPTPLEARTEQTITSTADLKRELAHIRRLGYAYDVEELAAGLHSIAAPVLDHTGHAVAAIGVSIPRARLDAGVITHIAALVRGAAAEASHTPHPASAPWVPGRVRVAWSMGTLRQEAYQIVYQTVRRRSAAAGADVVWADARNDAIKQAVDVAQLLELRPDVILIHPAHALLAEQLFALAAQAGVPAINFQRPVRGRDIPFFVGGNTYEQGRMTAASVARELGGSGGVAIIGGDPYNDNARNLAQGIYDELRRHAGVSILTDQPCLSWSRAHARDLAEQALTEHGEGLGAFIVANDDMAGGVAEVLAARGLTGRVVLVGGDGDLEALRRIRSGEQHGTAFQNWLALADETLRLAVAVARGEVDHTRLQRRSIFYSPPGPPSYVLDLPYVFADRQHLAPLETFWETALAGPGH